MPRPSFGDRAEEILFGLMYCKKFNKKLFLIDQYTLFWPLKLKKSNTELLKLKSPLIKGDQNDIYHHFARFIITFFCIPFRVIWKIYGRSAKLFFPKKTSVELYNHFLGGLAYPEYGYRNLYNQYNETKDPFKNLLTKKELGQLYDFDYQLELSNKIDLNLIEKLGINKYPWFVCLHVREEGFRSKLNDTDSSRNCSINEYYESIELVIKNGGCVVRLGDHNMSKLRDMDGLIDYANSAHTSELLDLYLVKNCRFYIGTHSGPLTVASLFQKDIISTNCPTYIYTACFTSKSIFLHQNTFRDNQELSIEFVLNNLTKIEKKYINGDLYEGYFLKENDSKQIFSAVNYYFKNNHLTGYKLNKCQQRLFNLYVSRAQEFILKQRYFRKSIDDVTHKKKLISLTLLSRGLFIQ
jgi:putative glycosyltransferase (TIGR04372 family)